MKLGVKGTAGKVRVDRGRYARTQLFDEPALAVTRARAAGAGQIFTV